MPKVCPRNAQGMRKIWNISKFKTSKRRGGHGGARCEGLRWLFDHWCYIHLRWSCYGVWKIVTETFTVNCLSRSVTSFAPQFGSFYWTAIKLNAGLKRTSWQFCNLSVLISALFLFCRISSWQLISEKKSYLNHRGEICPCRHCRRQCKIFATGVNFSIFTHFLCFF